jgi:hypothetical protein
MANYSTFLQWTDGWHINSIPFTGPSRYVGGVTQLAPQLPYSTPAASVISTFNVASWSLPLCPLFDRQFLTTNQKLAKPFEIENDRLRQFRS